MTEWTVDELKAWIADLSAQLDEAGVPDDGLDERLSWLIADRAEMQALLRRCEAYVRKLDCETPRQVPLGGHYVTRDMATDAGDRSLEGQLYEIEYGFEECGGCARCKLGADLRKAIGEG